MSEQVAVDPVACDTDGGQWVTIRVGATGYHAEHRHRRHPVRISPRRAR
jgi:hypothetical protein